MYVKLSDVCAVIISTHLDRLLPNAIQFPTERTEEAGA